MAYETIQQQQDYFSQHADDLAEVSQNQFLSRGRGAIIINGNVDTSPVHDESVISYGTIDTLVEYGFCQQNDDISDLISSYDPSNEIVVIWVGNDEESFNLYVFEPVNTPYEIDRLSDTSN